MTILNGASNVYTQLRGEIPPERIYMCYANTSSYHADSSTGTYSGWMIQSTSDTTHLMDVVTVSATADRGMFAVLTSSGTNYMLYAYARTIYYLPEGSTFSARTGYNLTLLPAMYYKYDDSNPYYEYESNGPFLACFAYPILSTSMSDSTANLSSKTYPVPNLVKTDIRSEINATAPGGVGPWLEGTLTPDSTSSEGYPVYRLTQGTNSKTFSWAVPGDSSAADTTRVLGWVFTLLVSARIVGATVLPPVSDTNHPNMGIRLLGASVRYNLA